MRPTSFALSPLLLVLYSLSAANAAPIPTANAKYPQPTVTMQIASLAKLGLEVQLFVKKHVWR